MKDVSARRRRATTLLATMLASAWIAAPAPAHAETPKRLCIESATEGQRARDDGHWLEAKERFLVCAAASCPGLVRAECARWLAEVDAKIPTIVLGAKNAAGADLTAVRVLVDGRPFVEALDGRPRPLDPGTHRLRFEGEGDLSASLEVVVRAGESARVVVATLEGKESTPPPARPLVAPEPPAPRPPPSYAAPLWVFGALTVASAAATTALVVYAHDEDDALSTQCSPRCSDAATRPLRTSLAFANVGAVAALLSLGGLGYFIVKSATAPSSAPATSVAIVPVLSPSAGGAFALIRY